MLDKMSDMVPDRLSESVGGDHSKKVVVGLNLENVNSGHFF